MDIPIINEAECLNALLNKARNSSYLAMYSSWMGGIVRSPHLMMVPIDDHMVHRGDAIFEAFRARDHKIYLLQAHLDRLHKSLEAVEMPIPWSRQQLESIIRQTGRVANEPDQIFRFYISRGPGGFTTNPYECVGPQLYIVATKAKIPDQRLYEEGAKVGATRIPIKDGWLATVKSCNYLPNVLMKKEAVDRGLDFTVTLTSDGFLGEGATENIALVNSNDELVFPTFDHTLAGTTLQRLAELAQQLVVNGTIKGVRQCQIDKSEILAAREMFMVGTTIEVIPVTRFEDRPIGDAQVGRVAKSCLELLRKDMVEGADVLTPLE